MSATLEQANGHVDPTDVGSVMAAASARYDAAHAAPQVDEPADETQETPTEEVGAEDTGAEAPTTGQAPEGLSTELLRAAVTAGVPNSVIDLCESNASLAKAIAIMGTMAEEAGPDEESEGQRLAKGLVGESLLADFDETDPVHRELRALREIVKRQAEAIGGTFDAASKIGKARERDAAQRQFDALVSDFDAAMDEAGFGAPGDDSRREVFEYWQALPAVSRARTSADKRKAAVNALNALHPDRVTKAAQTAQLKAIEAQNGQKLGGGPAKPAAPRTLSQQEKLKELMKPFVERARLAGRP